MFVTKNDRNSLNKHRNCVLWLTGLSGAGKSTLAVHLEHKLFNSGIRTYVLDGDTLRNGLNKDLKFSPSDRQENIRRVGEVSKLLVDAGVLTITALISPYRKDRELVRALFEPDEFVEIYIKCSIDECERRDPKGLYNKVRNGVITEFTGISAPYEEPLNPELIIETDKQTLEESLNHIMNYLKSKGYFVG